MTFLFPFEEHFNVYRHYCANINVGYNALPMIMVDGRKIYMNAQRTDDSLKCPVCKLQDTDTKLPFDVYVDFGHYLQYEDVDDPITDYIHKKPKDKRELSREFIERQEKEEAISESSVDAAVKKAGKSSDLNRYNITAGVIASLI